MLGNRMFFLLRLLLHFQVIIQIKMVVPCLYQFDSRVGKVGNFTSPYFPSDYPEDVECYYQFSGQKFETLRLSFFTFELEEPYSKGCLTDYVDISTITAYKVKLLVGRFCGSDLPSPIQTMHPSAEIIFKTNHIVQKKGFSGMYEFKDESMVPPPIVSTGIDGCGGVATGTGGIIISPGYPNSFPKDVECLWLVRVHHSQHIYMRVIELELHGSIANCAEAELSLLDGYFSLNYNPKVLKRYCGDLKYYKSVEEKTQMAPRNRVLVRFRTKVQRRRDADISSIVGFKLVWTAVNLLKMGQCESFVCKNSHYCLNSNSAPCTETRQYCIDPALVCNGMPNCSDEDYSDEDKCNLALLAGCGAGIGVALLLIFVGVICYKRQARMRKSMSQAHALSVQLRQLEVSPSFASRPVGNFYVPPDVALSPAEINCSIHNQYGVVVNARQGGYPTDV